MIAFIFPGQGAQYVGMGKSLSQNYPAARRVFEEANGALGFDLAQLCFAGPKEQLDRTENCQLAVLTVSIAALSSFREESGNGIKPSFVAGHSLGEYSALFAAGAFDFPTALRIVRKRGIFMEEASRKEPGGMAAVIGLARGKVEEICDRVGDVTLANINCPGQVVVSGREEALGELKVKAEEAGARRIVALSVAGPFHTRFMEGASRRMAEELEKVDISPLKVPLLANATGQVVPAHKVREALVEQIRGRVLWEDSVRKMISAGVTIFIELGPGRVLSGLLKRIDRNATTYNVEDKESLEEAKIGLSLKGCVT